MNTITTFDHSPSPNHSMQQRQEHQPRRRVERGDERIEHRIERARAPEQDAERQPDQRSRDQARARNRDALTPSGCQIVPVANIFQSVPAIWLGVVKNSLVPGDKRDHVRHAAPRPAAAR